MANAPLISIIMPVFNEERHLVRCLDSLLAQTAREWELLAVDDQSTDGSFQLLTEYSQRDARIRVLKSREKGIIPALRVAVEASTGQLITRMDADDYTAPQKLERLRHLLLRHGPGHLATGMVEYFSDEFELGEGYLRYNNWINRVSLENRHWPEIYRECTIPSPCWMTWREDFLRAGAHDRDVNPEDYDLAFRFYRGKLKVVVVPEVLHYWRDHVRRSSRNLESHANQEYFRIKIPWFLEIDRDVNRPLVVWGAGRKGKEIARMLISENAAFRWICETPSKWGHLVYGVKMEPTAILTALENPQIILAVSSPTEQPLIEAQLQTQGRISGEDYFWFC